jgi:hypothetical protein
MSSSPRLTGYSLQSYRKTWEEIDHPDRNAQFEYTPCLVSACRRGKRPAISVDTKKKEILGRKANAWREYRTKGKPLEVDTHDFPDKDLGKVIPYCVYDIDLNEAWVSAGISRDTAEFAVEAILRWWKQLGKEHYGRPPRLLITADGGGSNGNRSRLWKVELQRLADETGIIIEVCHLRPGRANRTRSSIGSSATSQATGAVYLLKLTKASSISSVRLAQAKDSKFTAIWMPTNMLMVGKPVMHKRNRCA